MFVSARRDIPAARRFFRVALAARGEPDEVVTDLAQALETVIEESIPDAFMQNLRRGHYELGVQARTCQFRVAAAFDELAAVRLRGFGSGV